MGKEVVIKKIKSKDTYDLRHRVMHPNFSLDYIKLPKDHEGTHFGLFVADKCVTVVSLFFENNKAQFRKLATEKAEQGKGYASNLLAYVIAYAETQNITSVWCNARVNKSDFYKKFGLTKTNKIYSKGGIDFIIMEKLY